MSSYGARQGLPGYDKFRTGLTFQDAYHMLWVDSDNQDDWKRKSWGQILRVLHKIKMEMYEQATAHSEDISGLTHLDDYPRDWDDVAPDAEALAVAVMQEEIEPEQPQELVKRRTRKMTAVEAIEAATIPTVVNAALQAEAQKVRRAAIQALMREIAIKGRTVLVDRGSKCGGHVVGFPGEPCFSPGEHDHAQCPTCTRNRAAEGRMGQIILAAFPGLAASSAEAGRDALFRVEARCVTAHPHNAP